ncbi:MAG: NAD(P)H-dependent oxidoreductase [Myxococcota bacterium]
MNVLMLNGSGKAPGTSTSAALGRAFLDALERTAGTPLARQAISCRKLAQASRHDAILREAAEAADLLLVVTPVYVDGLPAPLTRALEVLAGVHGEAAASLAGRDVLALVNCGFPETVHTQTSLRLVGRFAARVGMRDLGGLGVGGGQAIHGRELERLGGMVRHIEASFAEAAAAVARGEAVPASAQALLDRGMLPGPVYRALGSFGWWREARRKRADPRAQPYAASRRYVRA